MYIIVYRGDYIGKNNLPVNSLEDAKIFSYNEAQVYISKARNCRIENVGLS